MIKPRHATKRAAFTLIELLMVIAIIGVLISLLMAAVMKITGKGEEVAVRSDIAQLSQGIQAFMAKYGLKDPPPSRLLLSPLKLDYFTDTTFTAFKSKFHQDSYEYLARIWPRLLWTNKLTEMQPIGWGTGAQILEGHQCLVFFLGGIPSALGCEGFSANPINPSLPDGDRVRFFDFKATRLVTPNNLPWSPGVFYAYKDAFDKAPYAYFSAYKTTNGHNRYFQPSPPTSAVSDCESLGVWPYSVSLVPTRKYLNPDTFQIISAGQDGVFGTGTNLVTGLSIWVPKQPMYQHNNPGYDDMANFHDKLLGIPD